MKTPVTAVPNPWYREPWPWLLMSGPAVVVVAGFITLYLAVSGQDGLVVDDYYKQGKAINQALHRDDVARQAGLTAIVSFDQAQDRVRVTVKQADGSRLTGPLTLSLVHATRSGFDNVVNLSPTENGYVGKLPALRTGKWNVLLEDKEKQWRLQQEVNVGTAALAPLELRPAVAGSPTSTKLSDTPQP
jgi:hypothetical protein